jgi:hypothetical protein
MGRDLELPELDIRSVQLVPAARPPRRTVAATMRRLLAGRREPVRTVLMLGAGLLAAELLRRVGSVGARPPGIRARVKAEAGAGPTTAIAVQVLHACTRTDDGGWVESHSITAVGTSSDLRDPA